MSIAPLVFQGISKYSTDFQSIVDRAVSLAQLPVKALQNQQSDLVQQKLSVSNLSTAVADLAASIGALGALGKDHALAASSTDEQKVTATVTGATEGAYYPITDITSVARYASETSLKSYGGDDAVSSTGRLTLAVGNKTFTLDIAGDNTIAGLRNAINSLADAGVSANVITTSAGSYLSVSASATGKSAISLVDYPVSGSAVSGAVAIDAGVNDQLTIMTDAGTDTITLAGSDATLADVADDINAHSAHATASVVPDGGGGFRLVIESRAGGSGAAVAVAGNAVTGGSGQLGLSAAALLTANNPGANTEFKLNGVAISERGAVINDAVPGVTFTIKGTTQVGQTVGVTLSTDRSRISSALRDLVAKYNAVADQVNAQIGPSAGLLSGNSIIRDVRSAMLSLVNYQSGTGQVQSLTALGIELDRTGKMSFKTESFNALSDAQVSDAFGFLGSSTTGFGSLTSRFRQISDPITGTIKAQLDSFAEQDKRINRQVTAMTDRINTMQAALRAKLQAADALLASLESQQSLLTSSIQSLNYTSFGKAPGSN